MFTSLCDVHITINSTISDTWSQARAGTTSSVDFLKVAEAFSNEKNFTVWSDLLTNLASLSTIIQNTDSYANFKSFILRLLTPIVAYVGWDAHKGEGWYVTFSLLS